VLLIRAGGQRGEIESPGDLVTQIVLALYQMQYGCVRYDTQCPTAGVYLNLLTGFYRDPGIGVQDFV
jgi:hypothetical protein